MASANLLDGTSAGVTAANQTAVAGPIGQTRPNGWNYDTQVISNVTTGYATAYTGSYDDYATASAGGTNNYRFIRVRAQVSMPLFFLPAISGITPQSTVVASAVGGQKAQAGSFNGGLVPFAPDAHNANDHTNFGFIPGDQYTLKWGSNPPTSCAQDVAENFFPRDNPPSAHGFVDLGQGNGNSALRSAIVWGGYPNPSSSPSSVVPGTTWLSSVPGNRGSSIFGSLSERSGQDPDQTSTTWAQYSAAGTGNGRRIVTAPIVDSSDGLCTGHGSNFTCPVVGFGNFLLDVSASISGSSGPICATYIGPASSSGGASAGTDGTKVYSVALFQ